MLKVDKKVLKKALSSDHIPIIISIKTNVVRVNAAKRTYVEKYEFGSGANNIWRTIKSLTNRKTQDNNAAISFEGTITSDIKKVANQFNRQFTSHPTKVSKDKRQLRRHLQKLPH